MKPAFSLACRALQSLLAVAASSAIWAVTPQIATGGYTTMALDANGTLYGWGDSGEGLLGRYPQAYGPLLVSASGNMARGYSGWRRSYLIDAQGVLWGSGANDDGQLGDGTFYLRRSGLTKLGAGFTSVAVGYYHTLGVKTDGTLWSWGNDDYGQLGDGGNASRAKPYAVSLGGQVKMAAAGVYHSLALLTDGSLWAWGANDDGELGDGTKTLRDKPVSIGTGYTQVAAGDDFTLALKADGTLWAWGANAYGQLGDGTKSGHAKPAQIAGTYSQIFAGGESAYAIDTGGQLWAWGDSPLDFGAHPKPVAIAQNVASVAVGSEFILVQKTDGLLYAVGSNEDGQLGIDDDTVGSSASLRLLGSQFKSFAAGGHQALFVKQDGNAWIWGDNSDGQLAQGRDDKVSTPVVLASQIAQVSLGDSVAFAIGQNGGLWAWGNNSDGRLGTGTTRSWPIPQHIGDGFASISTGNLQTFGIKTDGSLWAWGDNEFGQLGLGDTAARNVPTKVGDGYATVAAGADFTLAIKTDGSLWGWGRNQYGQLGNGKFEDPFGNQSNPLPIKIGSGYKAVLAGAHHALALKTDGTAWAWGWNDYGQVGDGSTASRNTPVQVASNIASLLSADISSLVLGSDGKTYGWGYNGESLGEYNLLQAGVGNYDIVKPKQVPGAWIAASAAGEHAAYLRGDGIVFMSGYQQFGQLGDGSFDDVRSTLGTVLDANLGGLLDLLPAVPNQLQPGDAPAVLVRTQRQDGDGALALGLSIRIPSKTLTARLGMKSAGIKPNAAASYNVYIAAALPSGQIVSWFVLLPKAQYPDLSWGALTFPIAAFLENLNPSDDTLITTDVVSNIDPGLLGGATLFIGYGLSSDEMLSSGRYRAFFQVPS